MRRQTRAAVVKVKPSGPHCVPVPQLALDNALAPYFEKNFGFNITDAGNLAATFGMLSAHMRLLSHTLSGSI